RVWFSLLCSVASWCTCPQPLGPVLSPCFGRPHVSVRYGSVTSGRGLVSRPRLEQVTLASGFWPIAPLRAPTGHYLSGGASLGCGRRRARPRALAGAGPTRAGFRPFRETLDPAVRRAEQGLFGYLPRFTPTPRRVPATSNTERLQEA